MRDSAEVYISLASEATSHTIVEKRLNSYRVAEKD